MALDPDVAGTNMILERLQSWLGLDRDAPLDDVARAVYALLGRAPSAILTATLEDALGVVERPNQPGTTTQRPNWSLPLPLALEDIERLELARDIALALDRSGA
jgi:4-alpha-glucanotransferase